MPTFRFEDRKMWQGLIDQVAKDRPSVGKLVRVKADSKKHAGVEGRVKWHGVDRFNPGTRYLNDAQLLLHDAEGTTGFRIRIQPLDGTEAFFIGADKVEILPEPIDGGKP